jgi:hypothetical protein
MKTMAIFFAVAGILLHAEARYVPDHKLWALQAGLTTCVLGLNERNELQNLGKEV